MKYLSILLIFNMLGSCYFLDSNQQIKYYEDVITYNDWNFYHNKETCLIYSFPISSEGKYIKRNDNYIVVKNPNTIGIVGGNKFISNNLIQIEVGDKNIFLSPYDDQGWYVKDKQLLNILINTNQVEFLIYSVFENTEGVIIDKYSLLGFNEAFKNMQLSCNLS